MAANTRPNTTNTGVLAVVVDRDRGVDQETSNRASKMYSLNCTSNKPIVGKGIVDRKAKRQIFKSTDNNYEVQTQVEYHQQR